jgi:hypothetical protein
MQITIDSKDLLEIFIEAGIDKTDAKALILDIIMLQENPAPKAPTPAPKRVSVETKQTTSTDHVRLKPVTQLPSQQVQQPVQQEEEIPEDSYAIDQDEEEDSKPAITRVNSKTMTRPNFSSFGGDSTGLK